MTWQHLTELRCAGSYDHFLNFQIVFIIMLQLAMCVFCAVASYIWRNHSGWPRYQLAMYAYVQGNYENGAAYTFILLITFWILYSYLVPISLFVTMEIVKFWQVRLPLNKPPFWQLSVHASIWPCMRFGKADLEPGCLYLHPATTFWVLYSYLKPISSSYPWRLLNSAVDRPPCTVSLSGPPLHSCSREPGTAMILHTTSRPDSSCACMANRRGLAAWCSSDLTHSRFALNLLASTCYHH